MNRAKSLRGQPNRRTKQRTLRLHFDQLEVRDVPSATLALDFDTQASPTAVGYTKAKLTTYTPTNHFGWQSKTGMNAINRSVGNALNRDFHTGRDGTFLADVPNGEYDLVIGLGDPSYARDRMWLWAEGTLLASEVSTKANQFIQVRGRVTVTDGQLNLRLADAGGVTASFAIDYLTFTATDPNAQNLWTSGQLPSVASASDSKAAELGVRFQAASAGYVSGIRFYKGSLNTGTHTGSLWSADGTRLATATFTNESSSGWQEVRFASPVAIEANTTYVASYFAPRGRYAFDANYFEASGVSNGKLTVRATREGGGGTFVYGGGFPTDTYQNGNYWVDVVFVSETVPPTVESVSPADQSTGVSTSTTVQMTFSEAMNAASISANSILLKNGAGTTVSAQVTYNPGTRTATLTPSAPLVGNSNYTLVVVGGTSPTAVRDLSGNALAADFNSTFATVPDSTLPTANAGADKSANEASSVSFTGTAGGGTGALTYHWDFGDGGTAEGTLTPSHTYADNGNYTATLTVTDAASQAASDTAVVTVSNVAPTGSLSNNGPVNTNATVTISFSGQNDVSTPDRNAGYVYSYDFDNNGTWEQTDVTSATATTSYSTAGSKTVKARIKDKDGGFTDYTTAVIVNGPPTADAGVDKSGNEGSSVSFTGTAGGGVGTLTYHWDFGDGGVADGTLTPSHTFADNGNYTVTLTVTDAATQTASDTAVVTVANVAPTGSLSNNGPVNTNATVTITFSNQNDVSAPDRNAGYVYSYDFDNNGTWEQTDVTSATASTSFATAGSKTVKARIKDKDGGFTDYTTAVIVNGPPTADAGVDKSGNEGSSVSFSGTASGGVGTLTYHWDFGDGGTADGSLTPSHTFVDNGVYTVTLTVTDGNNQSASDTATVTVSNVAPTGSLSNNGPVYTNGNVTVSFAGQNDVSSADRSAGYRYSYDFDNNGTWEQTDVTTATATTSYAAAGSKTVKARIKDKDGGFTDYTTVVTVSALPTANAGADKSANESSSVSFTGTATGGIGTLTYHWDFGDSGTADGSLTPSHTFADNGVYTVTLTVTDGNNQTSSDTATVTVNNVAPTGALSNNGPVNVGANVTISFGSQNDVSSADRAAGYTYSFDFDNNGTWEVTDSTTASATTSYATSGSKTVKGRIKDKDGGFTDYTTTVTVNNSTNPGLVAYFSFDEGSGTTTGSTVGGLTGSISGATWATGQTGGALSFDGVNDWVTVADTNSLDLTTEMTLEAWVRPTAINGWETVVLKETTGELAYALYGDNNADTGGAHRPGAWIRQGSTSYSTLGTAQLGVNTWAHLAATYDGAVLQMYVNGTLASSLNHSGAINTSTGVLRIGGNSVWGEYFNGLIDDVRVYNRALSASEILADMDLTPTVTAVTPTNGANGVLTTTAVTVTFSEPMDPATISPSSIQLKTAAGAAVSATVTYDSANRRATLTPTAALALGATYTVVVHGDSGSNAVKDTSGKPMAADFTSTFTTTDGSPPTANAGLDKNGNEGSSISFTGASTGGTAPFTYSWDWGDGTATTTGTLTPTHTYADNGAYTVTLTVTDATNRTATDTAAVTVANVAPTGTLGNNSPVAPGEPVTVSFTGQDDASSADRTAGYKYSFDFDNNGTWEVTDSTTASASTSYPTVGTYTVKGRIKDKDGGATIYTSTVTVNNPGQGLTYYVSPAGSDTNNGSTGAPFKTLQKGASVLQPGDTLTVRAGTYNGFIVGWDPPGSGPYGVIAGTATAPITIQADPAAAAGTVIINGRNAKSHVGIDLEPGCDYITVSGFTIDGSGGIANYPDKGSGIKAAGDHDSILNNTITNIDYGFGITSNYANYVQIEKNTITQTGSHGNANYGHGIYVAGDCTGARLIANDIHNNDYIGLQFNGDPGLVTNALVANNRIYNNGQNGINADGLQNSTMQNNLIYGYDGYGIVLFQIDASGPPKNNTIVNNTILSTVAGAKASIRIKDGGTGNVIRNNILLGGGGVSIRISDDSLPGLVSDYNVVGTLFQSEDTGATQSLASWRTQTGQDAHSLTTTAALLFVNAVLNDYHLAVASPAIDKGTSTGAPATDLDGRARPQGAGVDIGAYEFLG